MKVKIFTFNPFQENTYLLYDDSKEAVLIDPGCSYEDEEQELTDFIKQEGLNLVKLINTHCHIDHVLGWSFVEKTFGLKPYYHAEDEKLLSNLQEHGKSFGFNIEDFGNNYGTHISETDIITFGNTTLEIRFCPGHAPGHIVFYHPDTKQCIVGDVIFKQSVGRTDLPFCNPDDLVHSIRTQIYSLPDETILYPGHGPSTTVGFEKKNNMFVRE
jgi:glyoxylase-like metal-dependent hydrolase (beta-lactamase superfamily II)